MMTPAELEASPSKGLYRKAFQIFCDWPANEEPSIPSIAMELGIHPENLVLFSTRRNWIQLRAQSLTQRATLESGNRAMAAAKLDGLAVKKISDWFLTLANRFDILLAGICDLPVDDVDARQRRFQLAENVEMLNGAVKAIAGLVETARSVGLVVGAKTLPGSDAGKLDFAKLTTLNLTLIQAQKEAGIKPVEVMELDGPSK